MLSSYPLWWFALPVLLLPIWWHRQKRQRLKAEPLATARFLPSAAPEQLRVWQWRDLLLLLVRCLLLVALIAWLAATIFPWRGDTVLLDASADQAWAGQQIAAAGMSAAPRIELPSDALQWLRQHERDWRPDARLLIVAGAGRIAMSARPPQFAHQIELRVQPAAQVSTTASASAPVVHGVAVASAPAHAAAWRALFTAFDSAGDGRSRYTITTEPDAGTELIVWDMPNAAPPSNWRAAQWWIASPAIGAASGAASVGGAPNASAFPELANASALTINGIKLRYADSPRGRLWFSDAWPAHDADGARAIYESWQALNAAPAAAYPAPSQTFAAARSVSVITDARPAAWLAFALLGLFLLERILTHARRN